MSKRERVEHLAFSVLVGLAWGGVIFCAAKIFWLVLREGR